MVLGALLDLGLPLDGLRAALGSLAIEYGGVSSERVLRAGVSATKFRVHAEEGAAGSAADATSLHSHSHPPQAGHAQAHAHTHDHSHSPRIRTRTTIAHARGCANGRPFARTLEGRHSSGSRTRR